ncbi:hypothetical protein SAMN05443574_11076 [Haloarcula vallismortis]|uniref:Uncharacterized protein n=1 Tax=Haloarcula vallismortis TaxID=28442 RepID=A0A1H2XQZ2_HALVA|nr:hypothetical protein SAMN05443574_11076 [Haloarcula vallismortis]
MRTSTALLSTEWFQAPVCQGHAQTFLFTPT